jgi:hypothetical protein
MGAGEDAVRITTPQWLLGVQQPKESLNDVIHEQDQMAGAQLRPGKHARHDSIADQLAERRQPEGEVALRDQGDERLRRDRNVSDRQGMKGVFTVH